MVDGGAIILVKKSWLTELNSQRDGNESVESLLGAT